MRRAERLGCTGESVSPVATWGGRRRRGEATRLRAGERSGMTCDKGRVADESGLQAQRRRHVVDIARF